MESIRRVAPTSEAGKAGAEAVRSPARSASPAPFERALNEALSDGIPARYQGIVAEADAAGWGFTARAAIRDAERTGGDFATASDLARHAVGMGFDMDAEAEEPQA